MKDLEINGLEVIVYSSGDIYLKDRIVYNRGTPILKQGRYLAKTPNGKYGYEQVAICGSIYRRYYVHRLVWLAFNGDIPDGYEIDHIDENPSNNDLSNLRIVTRKTNMSKSLSKMKRDQLGRLTSKSS